MLPGKNDSTLIEHARRRGYRVLEQVGSGGHGAVYRAWRANGLESGKMVALKVMHGMLVDSREHIDGFREEMALPARVRNVHVVGTIEAGDFQGTPFLALEYVGGASLAAIREQAFGDMTPAMQWRLTTRIMLDALAGLDAIHHAKGEGGAPLQLVHRDLSPQNILVEVTGMAKVSDLGIAAATRRLCVTGLRATKRRGSYIAPEQAAHAAVDARTDVYAAGLVLRDVLAGPRGARDAAEWPWIAIAKRPLEDLAPGVPAMLANACARALQHDPIHRWSSAEEYARALLSASHTFGGPATRDEVAAAVVRVRASYPPPRPTPLPK